MEKAWKEGLEGLCPQGPWKKLGCLGPFIKNVHIKMKGYLKRGRPLYSARNLEMSIRFSLESWPSERFHRPEMSQIKSEISLRTNVKLIFHKNVGLQ